MSNVAKTSSRLPLSSQNRSTIMRIAACLLAVLLLGAISGGSDAKEHIHFKIYVPEIIQHHLHTKTVYVHVPAPKKKPKKHDKPKTYHKEEHHENWSSWSYHDQHQDHHEDLHNDKHDADKIKNHLQNYHTLPAFDYDKDSYFPQPVSSHEDTKYNVDPKFNVDSHSGMVGYSYPPQYATHGAIKDDFTHEAVKDKFPQNHLGSYRESFEEGYRQGLEQQAGHVFTDELNNYHDDNYEEVDNSLGDLDDKEHELTNAGRYFVEEEVEENDNRRRRRRDRRILPKV